MQNGVCCSVAILFFLTCACPGGTGVLCTVGGDACGCQSIDKHRQGSSAARTVLPPDGKQPAPPASRCPVCASGVGLLAADGNFAETSLELPPDMMQRLKEVGGVQSPSAVCGLRPACPAAADDGARQ